MAEGLDTSFLSHSVQAGSIADGKSLSRAYRKLAIRIHPDTSDLHYLRFVQLRADYERALDLLSGKPHAVSIPPVQDDEPEVSSLFVLFGSLGLADKLCMLEKTHLDTSIRKKLQNMTKEGFTSLNAGIGQSVGFFFEQFTAKPDSYYNTLRIERCFVFGYRNYIEAVLASSRRRGSIALSYLQEFEERTAPGSSDSLCCLRPFARWMHADLSSRTLTGL